MKITLILSLLLFSAAGSVLGQGKYLTNTGHISFYSHTAIEDITADNKNVASVIDASSGEFIIIVKISDFIFEKKLMQEHFNENYLESEKYPKATFKGRILNYTKVDFSVDGLYEVKVEGEMTIHGITHKVTEAGSLELSSGSIIARTKFLLNPEDYNIKIPRVVRKNISENLELRIELKHHAQGS